MTTESSAAKASAIGQPIGPWDPLNIAGLLALRSSNCRKCFSNTSPQFYEVFWLVHFPTWTEFIEASSKFFWG